MGQCLPDTRIVSLSSRPLALPPPTAPAAALPGQQHGVLHQRHPRAHGPVRSAAPVRRWRLHALLLLRVVRLLLGCATPCVRRRASVFCHERRCVWRGGEQPVSTTPGLPAGLNSCPPCLPRPAPLCLFFAAYGVNYWITKYDSAQASSSCTGPPNFRCAVRQDGGGDTE